MALLAYLTAVWPLPHVQRLCMYLGVQLDLLHFPRLVSSWEKISNRHPPRYLLTLQSRRIGTCCSGEAAEPHRIREFVSFLWAQPLHSTAVLWRPKHSCEILEWDSTTCVTASPLGSTFQSVMPLTFCFPSAWPFCLFREAKNPQTQHYHSSKFASVEAILSICAISISGTNRFEKFVTDASWISHPMCWSWRGHSHMKPRTCKEWN